jgi:hypothetical protein
MAFVNPSHGGRGSRRHCGSLRCYLPALRVAAGIGGCMAHVPTGAMIIPHYPNVDPDIIIMLPQPKSYLLTKQMIHANLKDYDFLLSGKKYPF